MHSLVASSRFGQQAAGTDSQRRSAFAPDSQTALLFARGSSGALAFTMSTIARLKSWFLARRRRPLDELLVVEYDDLEIRVRVLSQLEPGWNQTFRWADIKRVCFEDGGMWQSDIVFVSLSDREKPAVVPTEAKGGHTFFGVLCERGLFPEHVWRKAVRDTSGGMHCWPPHES